MSKMADYGVELEERIAKAETRLSERIEQLSFFLQETQGRINRAFGSFSDHQRELEDKVNSIRYDLSVVEGQFRELERKLEQLGK